MIRIFISMLLSAAFMAGATGIVKETLPQDSDKPVKALLKKYREQGPIEIKLRKVFRSELTVKESVSKGLLQIKKDKLRLQLEGPQGTLTVIDGKNIWLENQIESMKGKTKFQVTKFKLNATRKQGAILSLLFGKGSDLKAFQFVSSKKEDGQSTFLYHPTKEDSEYQELKIVIDEKLGRIVQLSFLDSIENREIYTFGMTKFKAKLKDKVFKYEPPKGAEVTEI